VSPPRGGRGFAARVVAWQAAHGRHDLPWQSSRDPYRVWLAEVMLQQTQVGTAIPYYKRFCARFPDVASLAAASLADVLSLWAGLGYYARARNLHACAGQVMERFGGRFPSEAGVLVQLPGIGRSTASAIAAFCTGAREPILDGNVKRVLARHFAVPGDVTSASVVRLLWDTAAALLPASADMPAYTQGLMDLGATVCTRTAPKCAACPLARTCMARRSGRVGQFPAARRRRAAPLRRAWALLALHEGRVLLQRRAPAGVWGGLHSLPQFSSAAALRRAAGGIDAAPKLRALPTRRHAFTHFVLALMPRRLDVRSPPPALQEDNLVWLPLAGIESAPLPAPILALLREVAAPAPPAAGGRVTAARGRRRNAG
jgi:A/G-specific adenine glycosylase